MRRVIVVPKGLGNGDQLDALFGQFPKIKFLAEGVTKETATRRGLREDETTMEDRSSRRMRTLVTRMAHSRPVG
jgi:hypothetical protein